jgi:FtsH-binding integral membrane protein
MITMQEAHTSTPAPAPAWLDKLQLVGSSSFEDARQRAVWNQAITSAYGLTLTATVIANLIFLAVDYNRYASCGFVFLMIVSLGGSYAQWLARRQNVKPVVRTPSWPSTVLSGTLFGLVFFVLTQMMDPSANLQRKAVICAVVAAIWALILRMIVKRRAERAASGAVAR